MPNGRSRRKGRSFERELARLLGGHLGDISDIPLPFGRYSIEAKRRETLNIYKAWAQSERDAERRGKKPMVIFQKNFGDILVCMKLSDLQKELNAY